MKATRFATLAAALLALLLLAAPAGALPQSGIGDVWDSVTAWVSGLLNDEPPPPDPASTPPPGERADTPPPAQAPPVQAPPVATRPAPPPAAPDFRAVLDEAPPLPPEVMLGAARARQQKRQEMLRAENALQNAILGILRTEQNILKTLEAEPDPRLHQRAAALRSWTFSPTGEAPPEAPLPPPIVPRTPVAAGAPQPGTGFAAAQQAGDAFALAPASSCACLNARVHWIGRGSASTDEAVLSFPDLGLAHQTMRTDDLLRGCRAFVAATARVQIARQTHLGRVVLSCRGEHAEFTLGKRLSG